MESKSGYEKIGLTAWHVAYFRSQTDIKYAKEVFDELDAIIKPTNPTEIEYLQQVKTSKITPQFEARYKLINRLLAENKTNQILEIASGLAPRGLATTEDNPSLRYVEVDLPDMTKLKRQILQNLFNGSKVKPQKNLHIEDGDALDSNSLMVATRYFENQPIVVVNEGLLRYMNFGQKAVIAKNIHALLEKFGGVWITSDITLIKVLRHREEGETNRRIVKAMSGIDVESNSFENEQAAVKFFEDAGFTIERHGFSEIADKLVSPERLDIKQKNVDSLLKYTVVFVMRLKK